jgi:hypothetical protein
MLFFGFEILVLSKLVTDQNIYIERVEKKEVTN